MPSFSPLPQVPAAKSKFTLHFTNHHTYLTSHLYREEEVIHRRQGKVAGELVIITCSLLFPIPQGAKKSKKQNTSESGEEEEMEEEEEEEEGAELEGEEEEENMDQQPDEGEEGGEQGTKAGLLSSSRLQEEQQQAAAGKEKTEGEQETSEPAGTDAPAKKQEE